MDKQKNPLALEHNIKSRLLGKERLRRHPYTRQIRQIELEEDRSLLRRPLEPLDRGGSLRRARREVHLRVFEQQLLDGLVTDARVASRNNYHLRASS